MVSVRFIFMLLMVPLKRRPRIATSPVKGHFLSMYVPSMADRIASMRTQLVEKLKEAGSTHDWSHVASQIGMFAYTGMNSDMCDQLTDEFSIFLTKDGRISLAGLNPNNLEYVAKAIHSVTDGKSITSE